MAETRQILNSTTTRRNVRVIEKIQTTDATPTVAYSIPLAVSRATYVRATATAIKSDFTAAQGIEATAVFRRAPAGNVVRASPNGGNGSIVMQSIGDYSGPAPTLDIVANTTNQTIDIQVTGKASNTINWHIEILSLQNLS